MQPNELVHHIQAAASGDLGAFSRLYAAVGARLMRVIFRICRDQGLAEEVLQETFLKIWRGALAFDPDIAGPMGWMSAVARNAAIDAVRRREIPSEPIEDHDTAAPEVDPEMLGSLTQCLDCLPPHQRECVMLAYAAGYSREDLAAHFERPVGTIKIWLHRGLATLKACLRDD